MTHPFRFFAPLALSAALAACGGGRVELSDEAQGRQTAAGGIYKIGTPYQIEGQWYYPREDTSYVKEGIGSWYGDQFNGKRTANGEIFDKRLLTAAHPTLPMPILARVTNLENGKQVIVRINDRGPFVKNREIDLSHRAAEVLGYANKGTAQVRVEYLRRASLYDANGRLIQGVEPDTFIAEKPQTPRDSRHISAAPVAQVETQQLDGTPITPKIATNSTIEKLYAVQVGAFGELTNAERLQAQLRETFPNRSVKITRDGDFYRVKTGGANIKEDAEAIRDQIAAAGYRQAIVIDQHRKP